MASPQTDKGFIRVANELYEEILRRDFSKRQQNMLLFIMRLSYGCGRKECEIPKYNFFEIIGLYKGDIKKELKYLRSCKVIDYNEDSMIFSINKNYDIWQLSPSKNYDKDRLNELIALNLKNKKVSKTLTLEDIEPVEVEPKEVSETLTNNVIDEDALVSKILTKLGLNVSETLTDKLVKHELPKPATLTESKAEPVPKDIIKDNIKDNNIYLSLFEFWNSYKIICHKKFTDTMKKHIKARIDEGYTEDELKGAINNYAVVLKSDEYYFSYKWTLQEFMQPKNVVKFTDEANPFETYKSTFGKKGSKKKTSGKDAVEFKEDLF